jgi:hypothetical protein
MNNDFENELREALRPVDPDEGFAERVMSRIEATPARSRRRWLPERLSQWPGALAASVLLSTALIYTWHVEHERRGLEARRHLLEALHITGENLDVAYRSVMHEATPASSNVTGA